jgi:hypothetical protein
VEARSYHRATFLAIGIFVGVWLLLIGLPIASMLKPRNRTTTSGGTDHMPHNTLAGLRALPENQLLYPGAVVLQRYGNDPYRNHGLQLDTWGDGDNARSGTYLGVNATQQQVLAFYDARLRSSGWAPAPSLGGPSTEIAVANWQRDDLALRVSVLYNDQPDARLPTGALNYSTLYTLEFSYSGQPAPSRVP